MRFGSLGPFHLQWGEAGEEALPLPLLLLLLLLLLLSLLLSLLLVAGGVAQSSPRMKRLQEFERQEVARGMLVEGDEMVPTIPELRR